ncbi:hypothetical protein J2T56_001132 [Natronobacillus azotifigens]
MMEKLNFVRDPENVQLFEKYLKEKGVDQVLD